jgi:hypothetical protein
MIDRLIEHYVLFLSCVPFYDSLYLGAELRYSYLLKKEWRINIICLAPVKFISDSKPKTLPQQKFTHLNSIAPQTSTINLYQFSLA